MSSDPVVYVDVINDSDNSILGNDEIDRSGSRVRRKDQRIEDRNKAPDPWHHFWLPRQPKYLDDQDKYYYYDTDDSEDNTPRRKRLVYPSPAHVPPQTTEEPPELALISLHQLMMRDDPDLAPHSCHHCVKIVVDMRKQAADNYYRNDPSGREASYWRGCSGEIGFTLAQALDAASDGCFLFALLAQHADIKNGSTYFSMRAHTPRYRRQPLVMDFFMSAPPSVCFSIRRGDLFGLCHLMLYTIPGENPIHPFLGYILPPNLAPNSELGFTRARRWLGECEQHHSECRNFKDSKESYMPTRVLQIFRNPAEGPSSLHARLAINAASAPYAALSYCWGGDQPAKTTIKRLSAYEVEIPIETLPQTIKDALVVVNGIGLKYLWVDAMCIVQDDANDVSQQIAEMHRIYRGSFVTIAVVSAATSLDGFLQPRTERKPCKLSVRVDDNVFGEVIAMPGGKYPRPESSGCLYTRGWTFQENLLSTRYLCYGENETSFTCLESGHPDGGFEPPRPEMSLGSSSTLDAGNKHLSNFDHPDSWYKVVASYSKRRLTIPDDKLPAVSAIAQEYWETKPVTKYLAGLWKEDFLLFCLWGVSDPGKKVPPPRPPKYRAPSWSWASLDEVIQPPWKSFDAYYTCQLLEADTTLRDERNPFGAVKAGFMRVFTKLRRVIWCNTGTRAGCAGRAQGDPPEKFPDDYGVDPRLSLSMDTPQEYPHGEDILLWCIELCTYVEFGFLKSKGLLLEQVPPAAAGPYSGDKVFRRVGRGSFGSDIATPYWFDDGEGFEWREIIII